MDVSSLRRRRRTSPTSSSSSSTSSSFTSLVTMDFSLGLVSTTTTTMVMMMMMVLLLATPALGDWDQLCPKRCKCTYVSNRKTADCRSAGFSTVPTTLSPEIQELNLASNRIEYLEKDAFKKAGLVNLQKLYLGENEIRTVHKDAFRELKILIELDLKSNRIEKLHPHTFTGMEKLRVLDLSTNQLRRLEGVQFPVLPHLRKLVFTDNKISYIHNYAFTNLQLLNSLRLSGNLLQIVQPDLFVNNSHLVELELHDNPWECDCHLKALVHWVKQKSLLQEHVTCHSPERVSGRKLESITQEELACRPEITLSTTEVPVVPGQNASLTCKARGDPLPQIKWVLQGRVLTNMSVIPFSQPEQRYVLNEAVEGGERLSQLTITNVADVDLTHYTCVADNLAGLVEKNVSLVEAAPTTTGAISPKSGLDLYIIIAIATGCVILLIVLITLICCCLRRRKHRERKPYPKVNGVTNESHLENVMIVNPVEKPPRNYRQVPQTDVELTALNSDVGAHTSYDEVDYPEAGQLSHRKPLATLEEEVDDDLPSQDTTLPLDSTATPSHSIVADYMGHYPDLLDMTRPRAVSPTQLSYHSLVAPQFTTPGEWRYSYVHPAEYSQYPAAYVSPQVVPRPGYVTLPRRHRSPSWAGQSSTEQESLIRTVEDGKVVFVDPVYDTLGPRTTADGTSRTDLTRPTLHAAEPYTPHTPQSPNSPPSLPPYYTPVSSGQQSSSHFQPRNQSSTLPRSTPNLLDNSGSLSLPYHDTSQMHVAPCSPTPSNASTVHAASPAYKTANHSQSNNKSGLSSKSPASSRNESNVNGSQHNNNLSNKSDANIKNSTAGSPAPVVTVASSKKVPPKPPPKPSSKRLSVSSTGDSRKSSLVGESGRVFQDEGPDGTEV